MAKPVVVKDKVDVVAIELFASKGIVSTTIKDIAGRAGVAEGALYRHYKSKMDMGWSLYCREIVRFLDSFRPLLDDETKSFEQRFSNAWAYLYNYYRLYPLPFTFIMFCQHDFPEHRIEDERSNPFNVVRDFICKGIVAGEFREQNVDVSASILMGAALQPLAFRRYGLFSDSLEVIEKEVVSSGLAMLLGSD